MAMQQSGKGASGSGPNPALSDEQAEQFAASFTPAWDADDALGDTTNGATNAAAVMESAPIAPATEATHAPAIAKSPMLSSKQTMIGIPQPAHLQNPAAPVVRAAASSAEAIDPENVLEVVTAPPAQAAPAPPAQAAPPAPAAHVNHAMRTQVMEHRPPSRQPQARANAAPPPVAIAADPFQARRASSTDESDFVPKRSSKTLLFVIAGLAVAGGLGLFLKFALTDDAPTAPPTQVVTGPAVTTAEIPPPPPKVESPTTPTTPVATAVKTAEPPPPPLAVPPRETPVAAPRAAAPAAPPRPRGGALPPPPAAVAAPPTPPATPKTAPKPPNGGIVRDNPF